jgi:hypothetical protein
MIMSCQLLVGNNQLLFIGSWNWVNILHFRLEPHMHIKIEGLNQPNKKYSKILEQQLS